MAENTRRVLGKTYCTAPRTSCQTPRVASLPLLLHALAVTTSTTARHCRLSQPSPLLRLPLVVSCRRARLLPASSYSSSIVTISSRHVMSCRCTRGRLPSIPLLPPPPSACHCRYYIRTIVIIVSLLLLLSLLLRFFALLLVLL